MLSFAHSPRDFHVGHQKRSSQLEGDNMDLESQVDAMKPVLAQAFSDKDIVIKVKEHVRRQCAAIPALLWFGATDVDKESPWWRYDSEWHRKVWSAGLSCANHRSLSDACNCGQHKTLAGKLAAARAEAASGSTQIKQEDIERLEAAMDQLRVHCFVVSPQVQVSFCPLVLVCSASLVLVCLYRQQQARLRLADVTEWRYVQVSSVRRAFLRATRKLDADVRNAKCKEWEYMMSPEEVQGLETFTKQLKVELNEVPGPESRLQASDFRVLLFSALFVSVFFPSPLSLDAGPPCVTTVSELGGRVGGQAAGGCAGRCHKDDRRGQGLNNPQFPLSRVRFRWK
eukprot:843231-Rhodomonas_salina.2